ncbi:SURF1 family protein [uncultured Brevundimonas sp.]|uniref:SURF1 family protein n=1 Tax=uncultured Brevundimonas sp. TaxID=213418 RepID=UPI0025FCECC9|nr:SURF1 family protein [uncultured Brevundimonas sp.]
MLLAVLALAAAGFVALGVWQLERRVWKLDLIAQVDARVHAPAVAPPGPSEWPAVSAERDQYRRVQLRGVFLHDRETLTQAATALGAGYWVMTPLRTDQGFTVLINRGFVPPERRDPAMRAGGEQTVTGLLRVTEPRGGFLRANDPASNRWRSRDVEAIARAHGLADVAPYFIDADAASDPGAWPRGGLTVIRFPNSHLVYALTWFGMALLSLAGMGLVLRERRRGKGSDAT